MCLQNSLALGYLLYDMICTCSLDGGGSTLPRAPKMHKPCGAGLGIFTLAIVDYFRTWGESLTNNIVLKWYSLQSVESRDRRDESRNRVLENAT
jgi:hypothetical protein